MKKTILITGSTDGIGKIAATRFAQEGHVVYVHGRNSEKVNKVVAEIKLSSKSLNITGLVADFSDLKDVKNLAQKLIADNVTLDVLINNAGVYKSANEKIPEGLDMRFVVNYLAPYVFTNAVLPLLNSNSRIINLSSAAQAPVSLTALEGKEDVVDSVSYAQSKLALTMWGIDLAKRLKDTTVIALNPGSLLNTPMVQEAFNEVWAPADKGANIIYDLAISSDYEGVTGKYFDNDLGEVKGAFGDAHADANDNKKIEALLCCTKTILRIL